MTLTLMLRCGVAGLLAAAALIAGGCAANGARTWAQTAPTIAPAPNGAATVTLGALESES